METIDMAQEADEASALIMEAAEKAAVAEEKAKAFEKGSLAARRRGSWLCENELCNYHRQQIKIRNDRERCPSCGAFKPKDEVEAVRIEKPLWVGLRDKLSTWAGMEVPDRLLAALKRRGIVEPTDIQNRVCKVLADGEQVIMEAPTGSGKTLAMALPVVARLQPTTTIGVQVVVLVPSAVLAYQITKEIKWIISVLSDRVQLCWFNPQTPPDVAVMTLASGADVWTAIRKDVSVVVTTPGVLTKEWKMFGKIKRRFVDAFDYFFSQNLHMIMVDEVDAQIPASLMPRKSIERELPRGSCGKLEEVLRYLVDLIKYRKPKTPLQMIYASATANNYQVNYITRSLVIRRYSSRAESAMRQKYFPRMIASQEGPEIPIPSLNGKRTFDKGNLPSSITHTLMPIEVPDTRAEDRFLTVRLKAAIKVAHKLRGQTLLLLPAGQNVEVTMQTLTKADLPYEVDHLGSMWETDDITLGVDDFDLGDIAEDDDEEGERQPRSQDLAGHQRRLLVGKAATMRGLDFRDISHIIILKMPDEFHDYVHLAGRVGRAGRSGTVITLADKRDDWEKSWDWEEQSNVKFLEWDAEAGQPGTEILQNSWALPEDPEKLPFWAKSWVNPKSPGLNPKDEEENEEEKDKEEVNPDANIRMEPLARNPETQEWATMEELDIWGAVKSDENLFEVPKPKEPIKELPPEGSWVCSNCMTMNYSERIGDLRIPQTECIKCKSLRSEADAGPDHVLMKEPVYLSARWR